MGNTNLNHDIRLINMIPLMGIYASQVDEKRDYMCFMVISLPSVGGRGHA